MADNQTTGTVSTTGDRPFRCQVTPYPKIVFFYPLMFTALICAIVQWGIPDTIQYYTPITDAKFGKLFIMETSDNKSLDANDYVIATPGTPTEIKITTNPNDPKNPKAEKLPLTPVTRMYKVRGISTMCGSIFLIVFLLNLLVISFDFPGLKALALGLFGFAIFMTLLYFNVLGPIGKALMQLSHTFYASSTFYAVVSGIIFLMILGSVVYNRIFNQWIVESSRLLHRHGLFSEFTEYPVVDLQMDKEIDDVFEYLLLFSGTLVFRPNPTTPPIRLENIPLIKSKERKIRSIIRKVSVKEE